MRIVLTIKKRGRKEREKDKWGRCQSESNNKLPTSIPVPTKRYKNPQLPSKQSRPPKSKPPTHTHTPTHLHLLNPHLQLAQTPKRTLQPLQPTNQPSKSYRHLSSHQPRPPQTTSNPKHPTPPHPIPLKNPPSHQPHQVTNSGINQTKPFLERQHQSVSPSPASYPNVLGEGDADGGWEGGLGWWMEDGEWRTF
jgi:hypothetical protein